MPLELMAFMIAAGLFLLMLGAIELGRAMGRRQLRSGGEGLAKGIGAPEGAIFGLLGLLIAFTFSGAANRFEDRRALITDEANAIGTAWLRLDLLPAVAQPELRELFRRYLDMRLATYRHVEQREVALHDFADSSTLQARIWLRAREAAVAPGATPQAELLLLPALNEMFDITTTRLVATTNHPPFAIFVLLFVLGAVSALLVGYATSENATRRRLHTTGFAAVIALSVYVILDLEYPRLGIIRIDAADQVLVDLRAGMG